MTNEELREKAKATAWDVLNDGLIESCTDRVEFALRECIADGLREAAGMCRQFGRDASEHDIAKWACGRNADMIEARAKEVEHAE